MSKTSGTDASASVCANSVSAHADIGITDKLAQILTSKRVSIASSGSQECIQSVECGIQSAIKAIAASSSVEDFSLTAWI